ncbi:MAG TPA: lysyl oxidase family protein, partial [Gemmatimonadales bacterium]|nr:lysyl oxidase family protein [Gemmatimonadales bacterium]
GPAIVGNQGISTGRADQYYKWLGGQYFVLDGGDGQAPVPPGNYVIRIHVNPPFACTEFDRAHNRPVDPQGMCHNFFESHYDNNVAEAPITLPVSRPGRTGFGPGGGKEPPAVDPIDDENRPATSDGK